MTVLVVWEKLLLSITSLIGATDPSSTLFLFGILFALVILLHLSNKISDFSTQLRILAKEMAMLNAQLSEVRGACPTLEEGERSRHLGLGPAGGVGTEEGRK